MYKTVSHFRRSCMHHPLFALVIIIILLSVTTGVSSQPPEWIVYTTENSGLPSNRLSPAPATEAQGNLWIGTHGGMARFNGETWTAYTTKNSELPHNQV